MPAGVCVTKSLGCLDFLCLIDKVCGVLADSGGVPEDLVAFGIPSMTFREQTERPITVAEGARVLFGTAPASVTHDSEPLLLALCGRAQ